MDLILIVNFCAMRNLRISAFSFISFRSISFFVSLDFLLAQLIAVAPIACDVTTKQLSYRRFFFYFRLQNVPFDACCAVRRSCNRCTDMDLKPASLNHCLCKQLNSKSHRYCGVRGNKLVARNSRKKRFPAKNSV